MHNIKLTKLNEICFVLSQVFIGYFDFRYNDNEEKLYYTTKQLCTNLFVWLTFGSI